MLKCNDNSYYVGQTDALEERLEQHHSASTGYVSSRLPFKLVFFQEFIHRMEAIEAERKIKGWSRKKKEALIDQNWKLISKLSKKKFKK